MCIFFGSRALFSESLSSVLGLGVVLVLLFGSLWLLLLWSSRGLTFEFEDSFGASGVQRRAWM